MIVDLATSLWLDTSLFQKQQLDFNVNQKKKKKDRQKKEEGREREQEKEGTEESQKIRF